MAVSALLVLGLFLVNVERHRREEPGVAYAPPPSMVDEVFADAGARPIPPARADLTIEAKGEVVVVSLSSDSLDENLNAVDQALAAAGGPVDELNVVGCRGCPFGDDGVEHTARTHRGLDYSSLSLSGTSVTHVGLRTLLESGVAARLTKLDLRDNLIGHIGAAMLAESPGLHGLRELNLGRNHIHAEGAEALAQARSLTGLRRLELEYNFIRAHGAQALSRSSAFPDIEDLGLAYNFLGDAGAEALTRARFNPSLRLLDVRGNEIGVVGLTALATSGAYDSFAQLWVDPVDVGASAMVSGAMGPALVAQDAPPTEERRHLFDPRDRFSVPVRRSELAPAPPPAPLPDRIDYREFWIWEFDMAAVFPTFLTPESVSGNGKGRSFSYLDGVRLHVGGYWLVSRSFADHVRERYLSAAPGETVATSEVARGTLLIRRVRGAGVRVSRIQRYDEALIYVHFDYPSAEEAYFGPIASRLLWSLHLDAR